MVKYFKGYSKNQPPKEKKKELLPRFWHFFIFDKLTWPPPSRCFCPKSNYIVKLPLISPLPLKSTKLNLIHLRDE